VKEFLSKGACIEAKNHLGATSIVQGKSKLYKKYFL
jgi:hypothetical protein